MDWYEAEVQELIERLAAHPVAAPAVFFGSSTIRFWETLSADLKEPRAVNAGFGGSTLAACAHFFERIVPPLAPTSLVVYAGDNDLGDGRSPEDVLASYRDLAAKVERRCGSVPFAFLSIKPSPARCDILNRIRQANRLVRAEVGLRPGRFFIDLFEAMLRNAQPRPELFLEDGLHLSAAGYALWTRLLEPFHDRIFPPIPDGRTPTSEEPA